MKKKLFAVAAIVGALTAIAYADYKYGRCQKILADGTQCARGVSNQGDFYCWQHKR